jgi:hypothetical protein
VRMPVPRFASVLWTLISKPQRTALTGATFFAKCIRSPRLACRVEPSHHHRKSSANNWGWMLLPVRTVAS